MIIKAWKLHPQASKIERAEKSCKGFANKAGLQWCGPYTTANQIGFWLYPPIDVDFIFQNNEIKILNSEEYSSEDYDIVKSLIRADDNSDFNKWTFPGVGRTKMTLGLIEPNVMQLWTGLIFQTAPGWCLQIRSPINFPYTGFNVVEAILETDWLQYDIWTNISITAQNSVLRLRKDFPLAQLIPIRREGFREDWSAQEEQINRENPSAEEVFKYWVGYNKQKFEFGGKQILSEDRTKDSTTYFREKTRLIGKEMEPIANPKKTPPEKVQSKCPYAHLHEQADVEKPIFKPVDSKIIFK